METKEEKLKEKEPEAKKSLMEEVEEEARKQGKKSSKTWEAILTFSYIWLLLQTI